jgi:D-arginine dehydrogenase
MNASHRDIVVIGAGIAGLSVGSELAGSRSVAVLERESQPGYHSTGRSAALFAESYGSDVVRALTRASRPFYEATPAGFAPRPLIETCGALFIARGDQLGSLETFAAEEDIRRTGKIVSRDAVLALCPILREDYVAAGLFDPAPASIDVASLLEGYRRRLLGRKGALITDADVIGIFFDGRRWRVATSAGEFTADIIVNAAGAWADGIAKLAGVRPVGLEPRRRTAVLVRVDSAEALSTRALVIDVDEQFYFRSESGGVLVSPADESLSEPCDAQPEELDVAIAIDRFTMATTLDVRSVRSKWAGLRSFVADRNPVVGFDPRNTRFFWLAAQGGYGIQTAPALAELAAALLLRGAAPDGIAISPAHIERLSPARFA